MKHAIAVKQFQDKVLLDKLFARAHEIKTADPLSFKSLEGKVVATLFYEPSTRTRLSFEAATQRLGGLIISTENAGEFSSAIKGESLADTIRTVSQYADAIVLRHPQKGSAAEAANYSEVPIINAGDGAGEHPTQALLDLFTILENKKSLDGLRIGLVGDLLNGRTVHSLIRLLGMYKPTIYFIAPQVLQIPEDYQKDLEAAGVTCELKDTWQEVLPDLDVLYMTRIQKERFESVEKYTQVKDSFILTIQDVNNMKQNAIILHPLPRVNEIAVDVDGDVRAKYFEQAKNGLFVRMALLEYILK